MDSGKVLLGVLTGIAVGTLIGVLYAPDKGTSTRKKISQQSSDTVDGIKDAFNEMLTSLTQKLEWAKGEAESKGKDLYNKGKSEASHLYDKGKSEADHLYDKGKSEADHLYEKGKNHVRDIKKDVKAELS